MLLLVFRHIYIERERERERERDWVLVFWSFAILY